MEKDKNKPLISTEKLLYIDPPKQQGSSTHEQQSQFYPELTEKSRKIAELGMLRAVVIPAFKENPFVPIGVSMAILTLGYSIFCMARGQKDKASKYMNIQYGFQVLTVAAVMGGYSYRNYKKKNQTASEQIKLRNMEEIKE